jgi:putative addiction module killer protein
VESFPYALEYYLTETGEKPFKKWLEGLKDITARQKIRIRLDRVRLGNLGKNRSVGQGVYELKIDYGPGYRVYYGLDKKTVVLPIAWRGQAVSEEGHHAGEDLLGGPQKEKAKWLRKRHPIRKT